MRYHRQEALASLLSCFFQRWNAGRILAPSMILTEPEVHVRRSALPKRELSRFLANACERVGVSGVVTVLLTTDERIQELNRTFRRKNKPTDVLSFPAGPPAFEMQDVSGGDVAISVDMAQRQSENLGHSLLLEVQILILHGLLHLAGMDHEQDTGQMGRREAKLRREFGLPRGLIQRTVPDSTGNSARASVVRTSQKRDVGHAASLQTRGKIEILPAGPGKAASAAPMRAAGARPSKRSTR